MKTLSVVLSLCALLFMASSAQAYAVYNHVDHDVCLNKWYSTSCHIKVRADSHYNGEHGAGLSSVWASWHAGEKCYLSDKFSIPKGGYARIYKDEIKIYKHDGGHKKSASVELGDCAKAPK